MALLWSERADAQARQSLRQTIAVIRRAFSIANIDLLRVDLETVAIDLTSVTSDVASFRRLAGMNSLEDLELAVALYAGSFLSALFIRDACALSWISERRAELQSLLQSCLGSLLVAYKRLERHDDVERVSLRILGMDPLAEEAHRGLMTVYLARGQRSLAFRQYQRCRESLLRELAARPSAETEALLRETVRGNIAHAEVRAQRIDLGLTTRTNTACSALGGTDEGQGLIETLPRKGFRFVGPVREGQGPAGAKAADIPAERPRRALDPPDKPSIAVLPFTNMSGDAHEEYFADGIVEDIITELSRFSNLFVIARNSSFQYKRKSVDVRQVGRELGVCYVLEGSIRRDGDRVRISAQLIETTTGAHRWAERYDRDLKDVFAVQDEVARTIVTILAAHLNKAEAERTLLKRPATWQAYDYYLRAADTLASYWSSFKVKDLYETRRLLEKAICVDSNYARAYAMLSYTKTTAWLNALDNEYLDPAALERAYQLASKAAQLDPNLPQAHAEFGYVLAFKHQHDRSIVEFQRAVALNPNFTDWRFPFALVLVRESAKAIQISESHMQLDPFYSALAPGFLGLAHYMLGQYAEAVPPLRECVSRAPNYRAGRTMLAAAYAQLGQLEEARAEAAATLRIQPKYTIEGTFRRVSAFKYAEDAEHFVDGLRKAGLPER